MKRLALLVSVLGCSKDVPVLDQPATTIPEVEAKRAGEACDTYVATICACPMPAATESCKLSKALPEAIATSRRLATNPKAERDDAMLAAENVRKTAKYCIEETAKLASLGCP